MFILWAHSEPREAPTGSLRILAQRHDWAYRAAALDARLRPPPKSPDAEIAENVTMAMVSMTRNARRRAEVGDMHLAPSEICRVHMGNATADTVAPDFSGLPDETLAALEALIVRA